MSHRPAEPMNVRDAATRIVRLLRDAGHVAYFAGGCVRDRVMGLDPADYDIATDAPPQRVREIFRSARLVGEAFGVALVRMSGHDFEVATFRAESGYDDGRRPSHVEFTDAQHDAIRRDFTINGLFEDPFAPGTLGTPGNPGDAASEGIIDFVGGVADIRAGVIRAIGEPDERFAEDYLRMLRAARFASRLGFTIEDRTARAIRAHARYLGQISRERIGIEVALMLAPPRTGPQRQEAARLIQALHLDGPTLNEDHVDRPPASLVQLTPNADLEMALAAWMIDRHVAAASPSAIIAFGSIAAEGVLRRWRAALCLSNEHRDLLAATINVLTRALEWESLDVPRKKRLIAATGWREALSVIMAGRDSWKLGDLPARIASEADHLLPGGHAPEPLIAGDDLIALGLRPGPAFKRWIDEAYDAQLSGAFTDREAALAWLRQKVGERGRG